MRFIDRRRVPAPTILRSGAAIEYRARVDRYVRSGDRGTRPPKPPRHIFEDRGFRRTLGELCASACAYCETPLPDEGEVDAFRPWEGAENTDGEVDYLHYCWLALDWQNQLLACRNCVREKRNRFPASRRGPVGSSVSQLRRLEQETLLDPCHDVPFDHLDIGVHGQLVGKSLQGDLTIDVLDLNREALVEARGDALRMLASPMSPMSRRIDALIPGTPHSGAAWLALLTRLPHGLARQYKRRPRLNRRTLSGLIVQAFSAERDNRADAGWHHEGSRRRRYIRRVTVNNFRGLRRAILEFPEDGRGKAAGSVVVLGDNGMGKTSLLQATALGCLGPRLARAAGIDPGWCLTDGEFQGDILVEFWGTRQVNRLVYSLGGPEFDGDAPVPVMILGYGAYRLPAKRKAWRHASGYEYRVQSLFSERSLVNGALGLRPHLMTPSGEPDFDRLEDATRAINAVLKGRATAKLFEDGRVMLDDGSRSQPLDEISSGFKSIVAVTADIMDVMYEVWDGMTSAQAVVLIDEIDAHLHPSWRLVVVEALRETFPLAQFLMTTHDPLPLRGLGEGEVVILNRTEEGLGLEPAAIRGLAGMTIDQILTSDLFGLATTLDQDTAANLLEYYRLLARPGRLDDEELASAEERLPPEVPLGDTPRERLMYRVIDSYLARHEDVRVDRMSPQAIEELVDLCESTEKDVLERDLGG